MTHPSLLKLLATLVSKTYAAPPSAGQLASAHVSPGLTARSYR